MVADDVFVTVPIFFVLVGSRADFSTSVFGFGVVGGDVFAPDVPVAFVVAFFAAFFTAGLVPDPRLVLVAAPDPAAAVPEVVAVFLAVVVLGVAFFVAVAFFVVLFAPVFFGVAFVSAAVVEDFFVGFVCAFLVVVFFAAELLAELFVAELLVDVLFFAVRFVADLAVEAGLDVEVFAAATLFVVVALVVLAATVAAGVAPLPVVGPVAERRVVAADPVALAVIIEAPSCSVRRMRGSLTNSRAQRGFLQRITRTFR